MMLCDAPKKMCPKCKETKLLTEFSPRTSGCKPCKALYSLNYYRLKKEAGIKLTPEQRKVNSLASMAWQKRNPDKVKQTQIRWKATGKDAIKAKRWRDKNPEADRAVRARYYIKHSGKVMDRAVARHAAKLKRTPAWANKDDIRQIYIECGNRRKLGENVVVDHIIPLQGKIVSGLHVAENLRIISFQENAVKSNRFDPDHVHS